MGGVVGSAGGGDVGSMLNTSGRKEMSEEGGGLGGGGAVGREFGKSFGEVVIIIKNSRWGLGFGGGFGLCPCPQMVSGI